MSLKGRGLSDLQSAEKEIPQNAVPDKHICRIFKHRKKQRAFEIALRGVFVVMVFMIVIEAE
jgi:predicted nucleic acid-binding Zn ribbon protein